MCRWANTSNKVAEARHIRRARAHTRAHPVVVGRPRPLRLDTSPIHRRRARRTGTCGAALTGTLAPCCTTRSTRAPRRLDGGADGPGDPDAPPLLWGVINFLVRHFRRDFAGRLPHFAHGCCAPQNRSTRPRRGVATHPPPLVLLVLPARSCGKPRGTHEEHEGSMGAAGGSPGGGGGGRERHRRTRLPRGDVAAEFGRHRRRLRVDVRAHPSCVAGGAAAGQKFHFLKNLSLPGAGAASSARCGAVRPRRRPPNGSRHAHDHGGRPEHGRGARGRGPGCLRGPVVRGVHGRSQTQSASENGGDGVTISWHARAETAAKTRARAGLAGRAGSGSVRGVQQAARRRRGPPRTPGRRQNVTRGTP